jgi:hypothetical protein
MGLNKLCVLGMLVWDLSSALMDLCPLLLIHLCSYFSVTLVEKRLLVAHHFSLCVAHMGCATNATPLVIVYQWRISICATHSLKVSGAYSICAISILCVAHIAICATNT